MNTYTVWVGGSEMSSNLLSLSQAHRIVNVWQGLGYDDVQIQEINEWAQKNN